jgi:heptaprenyl diphosphate synthase
MAVVEAQLMEASKYADRLASDASRHLLSAGGKRLRPYLTLLSSHLGTGINADVITAATSVELTHVATLYHDDVQDSAPVRRGQPTAHMVWGNSVAIMVGDLMFAQASKRTATLGPEAVLIQAETFERLCLGQLAELAGPEVDASPIDHYIDVLSNKTASLVAASARLGAMFGGASAAECDIVAAYGEKIGVAFQLADDVLDLTSSGSQSGKTPGTDLREGVPTMPVLLLRQRVAEAGLAEDRELVALIDGDLDDDGALAEVVERLRAHDVVGATRDLARQFATAAVAELEPLAPSAVKDALTSFADALTERAA